MKSRWAPGPKCALSPPPPPPPLRRRDGATGGGGTGWGGRSPAPARRNLSGRLRRGVPAPNCPRAASPPRAPPRGGEEPAAPAPGSPAQPRPGRGRPRSCGGSERGGPCWGRLRGWGSFCTGIKRVFPRPGSPSPFFFEGDVRQGLILHRWAPSDRGAPKGGGASRCHRPATSGHRAPPSAERNGTGRAGTRRAEPGVEGRRRHGGSGRSGAGGPVTGIVRVGSPVTGCWYGGAVPGRCGGPGSCRAAELPDRRCWGRCPPPPSGHPPRSVQCPRIGAAAIRVPPHTAGPHLSHGCQHRGGP